MSLLRLALLAGGLAVGLMPVAQAQIREGYYDVAGTNPDGSVYTGMMALQAGPPAAWLATWQVQNQQVQGLGIIAGGVLAISFNVNGTPGITVYEVQPDGKLRGTWTTGGGVGTELLTPR